MSAKDEKLEKLIRLAFDPAATPAESAAALAALRRLVDHDDLLELLLTRVHASGHPRGASQSARMDEDGRVTREPEDTAWTGEDRGTEEIRHPNRETHQRGPFFWIWWGAIFVGLLEIFIISSSISPERGGYAMGRWLVIWTALYCIRLTFDRGFRWRHARLIRAVFRFPYPFGLFMAKLYFWIAVVITVCVTFPMSIGVIFLALIFGGQDGRRFFVRLILLRLPMYRTPRVVAAVFGLIITALFVTGVAYGIAEAVSHSQ